MNVQKFILDEQKRRKRIADEGYKADRDAERKKRKRKEQNQREDMDDDIQYFYAVASSVIALEDTQERKRRIPDRVRDRTWFQDGFHVWGDKMNFSVPYKVYKNPSSGSASISQKSCVSLSVHLRAYNYLLFMFNL